MQMLNYTWSKAGYWILGAGLAVAALSWRSSLSGSPTGIGRVLGVMTVGQTTEASKAKGVWLDLNPTRVEGHQKCLDCHRSELAAWQKTKHATTAFDLLRSANALKYAKALDIKTEDIRRNSMCLQCHATQQTDDLLGPVVIQGISCESCHGGSGGQDGWLNAHAVYGPTGTRRNEETLDHRTQRLSRCETAGQVRSDNPFQMARNCLACHIIPDEKLVLAGHPAGKLEFELLGSSQGEVRHNFHMNQRQNAEISTLWSDPQWREGQVPGTAAGRKRIVFILGKVADLHVSLRNIAAASEVNEYTASMQARVAVNKELLLVISEFAPVPEMASIAEVVATLEDSVFEELNDDNRKLLNEAATKLAEHGRLFGQKYDGSKLNEDADILKQLDELISQSAPVGKPYQP